MESSAYSRCGSRHDARERPVAPLRLFGFWQSYPRQIERYMRANDSGSISRRLADIFRTQATRIQNTLRAAKDARDCLSELLLAHDARASLDAATRSLVVLNQTYRDFVETVL